MLVSTAAAIALLLHDCVVGLNTPLLLAAARGFDNIARLLIGTCCIGDTKIVVMHCRKRGGSSIAKLKGP